MGRGCRNTMEADERLNSVENDPFFLPLLELLEIRTFSETDKLEIQDRQVAKAFQHTACS